MKFTTGSHPGGYAVTGITLTVRRLPFNNGWTQPQVNIHEARADGSPGAFVGRFTANNVPATATMPVKVDFTSADLLILGPNTSYNLIADSEGTSTVGLTTTVDSPSQDSCSEFQWTLDNKSTTYSYRPAHSNAITSTQSVARAPVVTISGYQVPDRGTSERVCEDSPATVDTYLTLGGTDGSGSANGLQHTRNDEDWFKVTLEAGINYEFSARGSVHDHSLGSQLIEVKRVLDSEGNAVTGVHRVDAGPNIHQEYRAKF